MTAVKGKAWREGPLRIYVSVHTGLEVLMAVGNEIIYCWFIILYIWESLRVPENRHAGFLIFGERERPEVKRTHGRTRHRKKNTKRDVQEIEWKGAVWINITQHKINLLALIKAVMNYRMLYNAVIVLAPKDHLPM